MTQTKKSILVCFRTSFVFSLVIACTRGLSSTPRPISNHETLFSDSRREVLNLLNHPLQIQLATGELPLGSFRRLVNDRAVILEGLQMATPQGMLDDLVQRHTQDAAGWHAVAENEGGKTIHVPGMSCFNCGGEHLNIDCPNDNQDASPSALALRSVLQSHGLVGASAVLRCYGFSCARLLEASSDCSSSNSSCYRGWVEAHATPWLDLASACEALLEDSDNGGDSSSSYAICLSMFYNWIDSEAATTGIRLSDTGNDSMMKSIVDALETLEPGYAAQRDKHQSFVADITGVAAAQSKQNSAADKVSKAAAYLATKKKKLKSGE